MLRTKCRSCNASVFWGTSDATNKRMPLDSEPSASGNIRLMEGKDPFGQPYFVVIGRPELVEKERAAGRSLYTSHFATCPNAAQHRSRA